MKLAVMQPYIFPYIGYFQLIEAVDTFVFYDDVNFIKQGWINRNKILLHGKEKLFTVPIENISSYCQINRTNINQKEFIKWQKKFFKTLEFAYRKAPHYSQIISLVSTIFNSETKSIGELAINSVKNICIYLGIDKNFKKSSDSHSGTNIYNGVQRLLTICHYEKAKVYINLMGGKKLYDKDFFLSHRIELAFLQPSCNECYYQGSNEEFVPSLSIIDVLMWNPVDDVKKLLKNYKLF